MTDSASPRAWLTRRPRTDVVARLFCFPYSGLGASMYNSWPITVDGLEICPVQLPARENRLREPHFGTYEQLGATAVAAIAPFLDRPFGFFGHCGGALMAFAAANALRPAGHPWPTALFVSSEVAPHEGPYGRYLSMSREELAAELRELAVSMGGSLSEDAVDMALDVLQADIAANLQYSLDSPMLLDTRLYAIGWNEDDEVPAALMSGWKHYAAEGRATMLTLDGKHRSFLEAPPQLLAVFRDGLIQQRQADRA